MTSLDRQFFDTLIIGAGVAGLFAALSLAPKPVAVLTARRLGRGGATPWAQGGVAAALGGDDAPAIHAEDTIAAGDGLVDPAAARVLAEGGAAAITALTRFGADFDRDVKGRYRLGREAAHSRNRIVHATGDMAGAAIMSALARAAAAADHITILERTVAEDLITDDGNCVGALVYDVEAGERRLIAASDTVLATGGLGGLYAVTTNPVRAQGHGLAFAARAGALIRDAEFVQFHPTALAVGVDPAPLATEALRGDGATLINREGARFMQPIHEDGELAPRDIVARAVEAEIAAGRGAYLDARHAVADAFPARFPTVFAACETAGIDPRIAPMPVAPAAHYHMGGVLTDLDGRSSVNGLWALGEVASSGVHGANRLASNSLLEAAVFGARLAEAVKAAAAPSAPSGSLMPPADRLALSPSPAPARALKTLRRALSDGGALLRSQESLARVSDAIDALFEDAHMTSGLFSTLTTAKLLTASAIKRCESRGGHHRTDYPARAQTAFHTHAKLDHRGACTIEHIPVQPEQSKP